MPLDSTCLNFAVAVATAGENDGQVGIGVGVGVADAAARENRGGIGQGALAVLELREAVEEFAELLDLVGLELDEVGDGVLVVPVVGEPVVGLVDAQILGQEAAADLEGGDAGGVGLEGEGDELVEHGQIVHRVHVGGFLEGGLGLRWSTQRRRAQGVSRRRGWRRNTRRAWPCPRR